MTKKDVNNISDAELDVFKAMHHFYDNLNEDLFFRAIKEKKLFFVSDDR